MESTRTVSFKDDTSMLCIATDVNSDNCKLNQHTIRKDLPNSTNLTSSQFNLTSPHREEFHDLNKPVSISVTESYLVHSRHHVPEYLSSENNNNDSILFITADSVTKPVNAITESSFSTTHIDFCKEYNHTYEIQSPLLKDCERKSHLFINDENFADSVFDTSRHAVCSEPSLIVTSPLLTTVQSTLLPVQTTPTNGKKTSLSTTENKTHLNTPIDSRKNTIQRDENWLLRSEELSSVLISQNEQKSIFHTQLVETL
ncbi:unnamed protein product [Heterobilharzia americana]|nr:unnamed protein product [Heterobilharzia americana]